MKPSNLRQPRSISFIILMSLTISVLMIRCKDSCLVELKQESSTIEGIIIDYDGIYKSGMLSYFDAISRIPQNEIFAIDSSGSFKVSFNVPHPIHNTSYLDIQGNYYSLFLFPGKDLRIRISGNSIEYLDENGLYNTQISELEDTINKIFHKEIEHCRFLHATDIKYPDYLKEQINLSEMKLEFIAKYEGNKIRVDVLNAIEKDTYYAAAKSWICFRDDFSEGYPKKRDTLFTNFYEDLFESYPVNDRNALVSREYIDYITNIKDVFSQTNSFGSLYDFAKKSNIFSKGELLLVEGFYNRVSVITNSPDFKEFYDTEAKMILGELAKRYSFNNILRSCENIPKGIGRDLIISQGLSSNYFTYSYIQPTDDEWEIIEELIETKFIYNYLLDLNNSFKLETTTNEVTNEIPETIKESAINLSNDIIGKYHGNVVYVDFWATWCGPCRIEHPYSQMLIEQFKDEDVVFLFLCCKSNKKDWENSVKHEKLKGNHYFLSDPEYNELSALFDINGFPTYVLIDKEGNVMNKKAPRPSSNETIIKEIENLLK